MFVILTLTIKYVIVNLGNLCFIIGIMTVVSRFKPPHSYRLDNEALNNAFFAKQVKWARFHSDQSP